MAEPAPLALDRSLHSNWRPQRVPLFLKLAFVVWAVWGVLVAVKGNAGLLLTHFEMTLTMVLGSFIAGATSEGGGAVAFPVMTLLLDVPPPVARDFSHLIQSVGMTAASLTILLTGIRIHRPTVLIAGATGALGVILSQELIAPHIAPVPAKLMYTSVWLSFGACLLYVVYIARTPAIETLAYDTARRAGLIAVAGLAGGLISGIFGTGLDILVFSVVVLVFRLHERIATPTSVLLMAGNSLVAVAWRELVPFTAPMAPEAWAYWYACVPVVVIGAPLGALFIARRSRRFITNLLLASMVAQYACALIVLPIDADLLLLSAATIATGLGFFSVTFLVGRGRREM